MSGRLVKTNSVKLGPKCPHCDGHGRVVSTYPIWRIDWHYQDGHEIQDLPKFKSAKQVEKYIGEFGHLASVMVSAISPAGVVYEWQSN